jgi:hypothetical protein
MRASKHLFIVVGSIVLIVSSIGGAACGEPAEEQPFTNALWRPGETTKYKLTNAAELEPVYMEDMAICGEDPAKYTVSTTPEEVLRKRQLNKDDLRRAREQEKWALLQPTKKDLVILAELFGCVSGKDVRATVAESGYGEMTIANPLNIRRDRAIRDEFNKAAQKRIRYTAILFRPVDRMWRRNNPPEAHSSQNIVWITTNYQVLTPRKDGMKYGSREYWIDCSTKEYQYLSDMWPETGGGVTTPGYLRWQQVTPDSNETAYRFWVGFCGRGRT